jgi:hypothetical protein
VAEARGDSGLTALRPSNREHAGWPKTKNWSQLRRGRHIPLPWSLKISWQTDGDKDAALQRFLFEIRREFLRSAEDYMNTSQPALGLDL